MLEAVNRFETYFVNTMADLAAYSAGVAPWTLTNVPSGGSLLSVVVNGTTATLTIAEGLGAPFLPTLGHPSAGASG